MPPAKPPSVWPSMAATSGLRTSAAIPFPPPLSNSACSNSLACVPGREVAFAWWLLGRRGTGSIRLRTRLSQYLFNRGRPLPHGVPHPVIRRSEQQSTTVSSHTGTNGPPQRRDPRDHKCRGPRRKRTCTNTNETIRNEERYGGFPHDRWIADVECSGS